MEVIKQTKKNHPETERSNSTNLLLVDRGITRRSAKKAGVRSGGEVRAGKRVWQLVAEEGVKEAK